MVLESESLSLSSVGAEKGVLNNDNLPEALQESILQAAAGCGQGIDRVWTGCGHYMVICQGQIYMGIVHTFGILARAVDPLLPTAPPCDAAATLARMASFAASATISRRSEPNSQALVQRFGSARS